MAKKQMGIEQAQVIDGERRRCNTMLGLKQTELETLRENLAKKTKAADEYSIRCEIMAIWCSKGKTIGRLQALQLKCLLALKNYTAWKRHSRQVLEHKLARFRKEKRRQVLQAWVKEHLVWKKQNDQEKFEKAVKLEVQNIAASYSKEIETLRKRLEEANRSVERNNLQKVNMQENLKKAFMRGVCALNFEAMNILDPNGDDPMLAEKSN